MKQRTTADFRRSGARVMALAALLALSLGACEEPQASSEAVAKQPAVAPAAPAAKAPDQNSKPAPLSETDRMMLDQAKTACANADFRPFFEAALRTQAVRERYFTGPITTASGQKSVSDYRFPIEIMDFSYIASGSAARGPNKWEYVKLEFNQAQDERYSVDWVRIDFGPNGNDEGETPEDDREYGPRGQLLFKPTAECWTLTDDRFD